MLLSEKPHCVYPSFYPHFEAATDMFFPAGLFGLRAFHLQRAFGEAPHPSLSNANWYEPWLIIQTNQTSCHHCEICRPRWVFVCKPLFYRCKNIPEFSTGLYISDKSVLDTEHVRPAVPPHLDIHWYTFSMLPSVVSRDTNSGGVSAYLYRLAADASNASRCCVQSTYSTIYPDLVHVSRVW